MLRVTEYFAKSLKIIETGTIRKLGYGYLLAFYSWLYLVYYFGDKANIGRKSQIFKRLALR